LAAAHYKNAQKHSHGCLISISIRLGDAKSWSLPSMDSKDLAQYIQATDSISKPWLLVKMRLKKNCKRTKQLFRKLNICVN
jgi:hypothetical protein